jgi:hypothetical protein
MGMSPTNPTVTWLQAVMGHFQQPKSAAVVQNALPSFRASMQSPAGRDALSAGLRAGRAPTRKLFKAATLLTKKAAFFKLAQGFGYGG